MSITSHPYSERPYTETQDRYMRALEDIDRLERTASLSSWDDEGLLHRIKDLKNEVRTLGDEIESSFEYAD